MIYHNCISEHFAKTKINSSLSHPSLGWLYVFSSFPPPPPQWLLLITSKPFELDLRYLVQRKYGSGKMYWVTLTQGHGCDIDKQKFACLQDKVRTTQQITTKLCSYIPLVMVITWLNFGGILLETLFLQNFLRSLMDISQEWLVRLMWNKKEVHWLDTGWTMWPWPLTSPMTLTFDFSRSNFKIAVSEELLSDWCETKRKANQLDTGLTVWSCPLSTRMTLTFKGQSLKWPYLRNGSGGADWHGKKGLWVNLSWPWLWPMGKHGGVGGCTV